MSQLVETIKVLNGQIYRLSQHNERLNRSRERLFAKADPIALEDYIDIPASHQEGLYKCRVLYAQEIDRIELLPNSLPTISSLQVVHSDNIDYSHKWTNRSELRTLYDQKKEADDIIIVKEGLITDAFYYNVAFKQEDKWYTPESPLLQGTQRAHLLLSGTILSRNISASDLEQYTHVCLFNALNEFNEIVLDIVRIQR